MIELIKRWTFAVFAVVFMMAAAVTYWRTGHANWTVASVLATISAVFFPIRAHFLLKPELKRLDEERRAYRDQLFEEGCGEVAERMSLLSIADFSVFVSCHQMLAKGEDSYTFLTCRGSPMHDVLVRMADVRCVRPREMKKLHPEYDLTTCTYDLTKLGEALLLPLLRDATHRRRLRTAAA